MKNLENVSKLFQDQESTKVISTVSKDGELHSIVAGSIMVLDNDTMAVAEVFMNTTRANLTENDKASLLAVKAMESYLVNATVQKRHTDGALFDAIAENFAKMNMQIKAVWTFTVDKIYDESAGPNGGKQIF
ncbi:MAG: pyridoxamine 5'-phosphate oxidase family protein [Clostridia bacterium]